MSERLRGSHRRIRDQRCETGEGVDGLRSLRSPTHVHIHIHIRISEAMAIAASVAVRCAAASSGDRGRVCSRGPVGGTPRLAGWWWRRQGWDMGVLQRSADDSSHAHHLVEVS